MIKSIIQYYSNSGFFFHTLDKYTFVSFLINLLYKFNEGQNEKAGKSERALKSKSIEKRQRVDDFPVFSRVFRCFLLKTLFSFVIIKKILQIKQRLGTIFYRNYQLYVKIGALFDKKKMYRKKRILFLNHFRFDSLRI